MKITCVSEKMTFEGSLCPKSLTTNLKKLSTQQTEISDKRNDLSYLTRKFSFSSVYSPKSVYRQKLLFKYYFRSTYLWCFSLYLFLKPSPQVSQINGFSVWWTKSDKFRIMLFNKLVLLTHVMINKRWLAFKACAASFTYPRSFILVHVQMSLQLQLSTVAFRT